MSDINPEDLNAADFAEFDHDEYFNPDDFSPEDILSAYGECVNDMSECVMPHYEMDSSMVDYAPAVPHVLLPNGNCSSLRDIVKDFYVNYDYSSDE
jgi:hypothetical protein